MITFFVDRAPLKYTALEQRVDHRGVASVAIDGKEFGVASNNLMTASPPCHKCGSSRTQIVGQSAAPAGLFVRCAACGYSSLVAADTTDAAPAAGDLDARRVERLVRMVVDDRHMHCELQGVVRTPAGWRVTALIGQREVVRFDVKAGGFAAMRADIERALATT